jgi:hypothetical protein
VFKLTFSGLPKLVSKTMRDADGTFWLIREQGSDAAVLENFCIFNA